MPRPRWRAAGVNRVSLGAQSFDDRVLRWMHRSHDAARIGAAVRRCVAAGIDNVSLDLIFALPRALQRDWSRDLDSALALEPAHLSLYGLTVEPRTPLASLDRRVGPSRRSERRALRGRVSCWRTSGSCRRVHVLRSVECRARWPPFPAQQRLLERPRVSRARAGRAFLRRATRAAGTSRHGKRTVARSPKGVHRSSPKRRSPTNNGSSSGCTWGCGQRRDCLSHPPQPLDPLLARRLDGPGRRVACGARRRAGSGSIRLRDRLDRARSTAS